MKFDCPECLSKKSLKQLDARGTGGLGYRVYECELCKERFESKERLVGKSRSIKLNNRKYRK